MKKLMLRDDIDRPGCPGRDSQLDHSSGYDHSHVSVDRMEKLRIRQAPYDQPGNYSDVDIPEIVDHPGPAEIRDMVVQADPQVKKG